MITYTKREAIMAIANIENAVMSLEIFRSKATAAIPVINQVLDELIDGGLEERDKYRFDLFTNLVGHLKSVHKLDEKANHAEGNG